VTAVERVDPIDLLRQRLAGTAEQPRNLAQMSLPAGLEKLLTPKLMASLRPAAVLIPILRHAGGDTILLTRRADTLRNHTGQISFPGGRCDDTDATLADTALRESLEEVGLPPAQVEVLGYLDDFPTLTGYRITPVVGLVTPPFTAVTDPGEVAAVFELPLAEVLKRERFVQKTLIRDTVKLPFHELQHGEYRIWGATAAILWHLHGVIAGELDRRG
jgi:8-oxo-dGTP pyrophosphatase MutT (NUDIX family)